MSEKIEWILLWGAMLFLLAAVFRTVAYLILRGQRKRKETHSICTMATVTEVDCKTIGSYHTNNYFPVVEYQAGESIVRGRLSFGTSDKKFFYIGQTLELYYDPNQIDDFYIPILEKQLGYIANVFTIVSYAMLIVGVIVCVGVFIAA